MRILFIVKKQYLYGQYSSSGISSGLFNSANYVRQMLHDELRFRSKIVVVTDNNDIDREVTSFRPHVVIIEALFVVPEKFRLLRRLHPTVRWIVRNHSAMPFLANEGSAMDWLLQYPHIKRVYVGCNDLRPLRELQDLTGKKVLYLPNYYPPKFTEKSQMTDPNSPVLDIGCFGAIRPLKNQLLQAVAAMRYANERGQLLNFHMNGTRVEGPNAILKNIMALFTRSPHTLILYPWMNREDFISVVRRMDAGMQVSYSETFNIVAADFVMNDIPVVVGPEIKWVCPSYQANPNDSDNIKKLLGSALWTHRQYPNWHPNVNGLLSHNKHAVSAWATALEHLTKG
jgi:hypothetical protein